MKYKNITYLIYAITCALLLVACSPSQNKFSSKSEVCGISVQEEGEKESIFVLDGEIINKSDLPADMKEIVYQTEYEAYSKKLMLYKQFALRLYLAKKQNKLKDPKNPPQIYELIAGPNVKDEEVKLFYEQNKNRMSPGTGYAQIKSQLVQYLKKQKMAEVLRNKIVEIEKKNIFRALLIEPKAQKITINTNGYPQKGNKNAKIKIIEVSDYLCGHCIKAHPKVQKLVNRYKNKVSLTQINFSLRPSGLSGAYVRGGFCAQKQGDNKFWKYHNETFIVTSVPHKHKETDVHTENDGNAKESIQKVKNIAKKSGVNMKKFSKCLNSQEAYNYIKSTTELVQAQGINGTPVFIVNNKKLARGIQELEEVIKENL